MAETPSSRILVADGAGGMREVRDARFDAGAWPIEVVVPAKRAEGWMAHLHAEVEERGWNSSSLSQLEPAQNSGTVAVHAEIGPSPPTLDIAWERLRGKELRLRGRPGGALPMPLDQARDFIDAVNARAAAGTTIRVHRRALLAYDGLPWRGELWLDADHCLGPPSKHPDSLIGPQILVVDAMVEGIGRQGVDAAFQIRLHELRVFLGFVLGSNLRISGSHRDWVCAIDANGTTQCALGYVGYAETTASPGFPAAGRYTPVERRQVTRPGLGLFGIWPGMREQWVPADIEQLWASFAKLPTDKREHLLRAGNAYTVARSLWPDQRTAYAAFLVVACEALKPSGKRHDRLNVYDVVASLVGLADAKKLREATLHPQKVRSEHFHRGKLAAGELLPLLMHDHFKDPSFDETLGMLSTVSRICLIEWLRCGGVYAVIRVGNEKRGNLASVVRSLKTLLSRLGFA